MERAAAKCAEWLEAQNFEFKQIKIFCGKGNNGGDGLALARMLTEKGIDVGIYILEHGRLGTDDFQANLQRLHHLPPPIHFIQSEEHFPVIDQTTLVVDALFGTGINKPLDGLNAALVNHINKACTKVISIDMPSGLFTDKTSKGNVAIKATHTLTFQCFKLALLVAENAPFFGKVHLLDIGLHPNFLKTSYAPFELVEHGFIKNIFQPRNSFAHKGTYGHALIISGSYGKMGAAILCTLACLKSGSGLVTAFIPKCGYTIMQTAVPEAMVITDEEEKMITQLPQDLDKYNTIGIGPGIGTDVQTVHTLSFIIKRYKKPVVIDADGLNCLAQQPTLLHELFKNTILTPHPKEFDRLFGESENDFDRIAKAKQKAKELGVVIVLKGHHTLIALPGGEAYFNNTGNAGLAKGGTGDVLTGIITALVAQGYTTAHAALVGVYLHGLAGDFAAKSLSMEVMTAQDVITYLTPAFAAVQ